MIMSYVSNRAQFRGVGGEDIWEINISKNPNLFCHQIRLTNKRPLSSMVDLLGSS